MYNGKCISDMTLEVLTEKIKSLYQKYIFILWLVSRCTTELEESGLKIPHGEIFECLSGHPTASESSRLCCKDEDFCNKHLSPTFPPPTTRIPEIRGKFDKI